MKKIVLIFIAILYVVSYGDQQEGGVSLKLDLSTDFTEVNGVGELIVNEPGSVVAVKDTHGFLQPYGRYGFQQYELYLPESEYLLSLKFELDLPPLFVDDTITISIAGENFELYSANWLHRITEKCFLVKSSGDPIIIEVNIPTGDCYLSGLQLQNFDVQLLDSIKIEKFVTNDQLMSVELNWSLSFPELIESISVLRSESLFGQYELIANVSCSYTNWIDWDVEIGDVYFYQLKWRDIVGNDHFTEITTPPFGSPLPIPDGIDIINLQRLKNDLSDAKSDEENKIKLRTMIDNRIVEGDLIRSGNGKFDVLLQSDEETYRLVKVDEWFDLLNPLVLSSIIYPNEDKTDFVWGVVDDDIIGLCIIKALTDSESEKYTTKLIQLFKWSLHQMDPTVYYAAIESIPNDDIFSISDLPFSYQVKLFYHLTNIIEQDVIRDLLDNFKEKRETLLIGRGNRGGIFANRNLNGDIENVISQWLDSLENQISVLGDVSALKLTEIGIDESGRIPWVELLATGREPIVTSDYYLSLGEKKYPQLPEMTLLPGEVLLYPIPEISLLVPDSSFNSKLISVMLDDSTVDSFWIPGNFQDRSIGKLPNGEFICTGNSTPGIIEKSDIKPYVYINEYSVKSGKIDSESGEFNEGVNTQLELEIFIPNKDEIPFLDLRLVVDFDENNIVTIDKLDITKEYHYISEELSALKNKKYYIQLQLLRDDNNWINEQIIFIDESKGDHWSRMPDGGEWQNVMHKSFGESNDPSEESPDLQIVPEIFALYQNYPNPFNASTTIKFDLLKEAMVSLVVVNATGREVGVFLDEESLSPGTYSYQWKGEQLSSGVYFFSLKAITNDYIPIIDSRKMIYLK